MNILRRHSRSSIQGLLYAVLFLLSPVYAGLGEAELQEIETLRERIERSKSPLSKREGDVVDRWINQLRSEGWVKDAGFHIHMGKVMKLWKHKNEKKKWEALTLLNELTELIQADGSVGNIRKNAWLNFTELKNYRRDNNTVTITLREPSGLTYDLHLSLYRNGVIHFLGAQNGYFSAEDLLPATVTEEEGEAEVKFHVAEENLSVLLTRSPFSLSVLKGEEVKFQQIGFSLAESTDAPRGVRLKFMAERGDQYLGFGERFDRLNQHGQTFAQWSMGMSNALAEGAPETYKPIPFYVNPVRKCGFFYNHGGIIRWDLQDSQQDEVDLTSLGAGCDYFLFLGDEIEDVYKGYTAVTGRIFSVPEWVHLPWLGHHFGTEEPGGREGRLEDELVNFHRRGITYGAMYAAGVSQVSRPSLRLQKKYFKPLEIKWGTHLSPTIKPHTANYKSLTEEQRENAFIKREDGSVFISDHAFQATARYWDFSLPEVSEISFEDGVQQIFMLDFGEQVPWDGMLANYPHLNGREFHNLYQLLYHKAAFEFHNKKYPEGEWMSFARSGWAGSHALGGFFAGDHSCSMEHLERVIMAGQNMGTSAAIYWGADIGGYLREPELTRERYLRWVQFGCFSPLMRTHGHESKEMRPWAYGAEMTEDFKFYSWLRASLVPYFSAAGEYAHQTGFPMMHPLALRYPEHPAALQNDAYFLGKDLLIAPYTSEKEHEREVLLPPGRWYHFFTHQPYDGGERITVKSDGGQEMPVFVKAPAVIPMRISPASPIPGMSYFKSPGTTRYQSPPVPSYRLYLSPDGTVQYEDALSALHAIKTSSEIRLNFRSFSQEGGKYHFEIIDADLPDQVSINGTSLSPKKNWKELMKSERGYFYDEGNKRLYLIDSIE